MISVLFTVPNQAASSSAFGTGIVTGLSWFGPFQNYLLMVVGLLLGAIILLAWFR